MKYAIIAACLLSTSAFADTNKVFGNANVRVMKVEENRNVSGKGALSQIGSLGPLMPMNQAPLRPMLSGPIAPMIMPPLMPRLP